MKIIKIMNKLFSLLVGVSFTLTMWAIEPTCKVLRSEEIRADLMNPNLQRVLVASHRADWRGWPMTAMVSLAK